MPDWAWMLVLLLPIGYLRLVAHELSHACTQVALGGKVYWRKFRPWPHRAKCDCCSGRGVCYSQPKDGVAWPCDACDGTGKGRWSWGRMFREDMPGKIDDLLVSLAPLERAMLFMFAWVAPAIEWWPLFVCVFWELTDVVHWWRGWGWQPHSDGGKARAILYPKDP